MAAGAYKCLLKTSSNFQSSAMYEGSESTEEEGCSTYSTMMGSSVTACKKVLCSNSVLDSSEYWVRNEKVLCRLGLLEDDTDGSCTTICFLNVDQQKVDYHDDRIVKKLAQISPDLPKLVESLSVRQPKENEILLFGGLEAPDSCQTHPHTHTQGHQQRGADVCLLQCTGRRQPTQPSSVIFDINKFLIGLQWGQDQQAKHGRPAGHRVDDDTNRSISSIEEDFLTASEHLGDDSEDDGYRNEPEKGDMADRLSEIAQHHYIRPGLQKGRLAERQDIEDIEVTASTASKRRGSQRASVQVRESAGHYATNLAESVLQDAFIRLSQDETSFVSEAAVSVSLSGRPASNGISQTKEPSRQRTLSFELPKIVIVQSPDSSEGAAEWPDTQTPQVPEQDVSTTDRQAPELRSQPHNRCQREGHPSKSVEVALACAANVIGTITHPQVTEQIMMESASEEETEEELQDPEDKAEYSFSSAMSGMAQVAGAVAVVDLTEETGDSVDSDGESVEVYTASRGLMSVAEASAAFTLHCSVAEGTSIEAFRANIAEVLHREAATVLAQPQGYKSVAHLLEATHNRIVDGITCPKKSYMDETEVDDFISEVADSLFKHALEKAKKKKELEGPGKDVPNIEGFLQDSVNNLLFDILCLTQRKITDISRSNRGSVDTQEGDICMRETTKSKVGRETFSQSHLACYSPPNNNENQSSMYRSTDKLSMALGMKEENYMLVEKINYACGSSSSAHSKEQQQIFKQGQTKPMSSSAKDCSDQQQNQQGKGVTREPLSEISLSRRGRFGTPSDSRQSSLTPQSSLNSCSSLLSFRMDSETKTPVNCFADDLATTVVSMATELAAIYLENSTGKQPWFCALKGASDGPEAYLLPTCRSALRRKEGQNGSTASKKHRAPRLSEIKRKTEEHPELMERLVNRVVDETVNPDEPQDPFALFASEVTARIMNCPELNVVDTSKPGQPRSRLQCERWSRGKPASYESIPEEHDPSGTPNTLGPGSRLGQNLSRGSSISKQSSCESITDEFSRFMVNQMETEGRGFDLLLDYYAGKNASSILAAAVQQAATKKNGHLNVRTNSCLSKQSSTESISEEFYRFMLRDMDKENKEFGMAKTREWSNSLLPPSPRTAFCIRQSSVPDRRSSDSRLTVNSPIKANSFDGFARNVHGDTLNIYPNISVSATGLCKSDSCLYQRGHSDQITDMLIHETWSSSIESLMRKNRIIADPEDSIELEAAGDSQPHVQQFANRLAADIVETGKSALGNQQVGWQPKPHTPVGERRRGFKQSRPSCSQSKVSQEQAVTGARAGVNDSAARPMRGPRDVPLIHIEADQKDEETLPVPARAGGLHRDMTPNASAPKCGDKAASGHSSSDRDRPTVAVAAVGERDKRSMSASSEESTGSWSHITPEDDPQDETSSFIQLSEGNATSSASSLGLADLDAFSDVPSQSTVICEETEKGHLKRSKEKVIEGRSVGGSSGPRVLLVVNCDLESECVDSELRVALQWIAASELGLPGLYFSKSKEKRASKFQRVVHLVSQKAWRIADLFGAVVEFCKLSEKEEGGPLSSLFDWLLETL